MRSRRKRRWMKMKQDLQQEAEEEEAVVGGRKG
jgi:ATP-dependent DNA ligase